MPLQESNDVDNWRLLFSRERTQTANDICSTHALLSECQVTKVPLINVF